MPDRPRIRGPWNDWLADPLSRDHLVHFYKDPSSLADAVAIFAGAGLAKGEAVVLVTTRENGAAVRRALREDGVEIEDLERWGQLRVLDADDRLDELLLEGMPDPDQFRVLSSALIADARKASRNGRVRMCGEMVNLLWRRGQQEAAFRLEELWTDVVLSYAIPMLCFYGVEDGAAAPQSLCDAHTHVVPVEACA